MCTPTNAIEAGFLSPDLGDNEETADLFASDLEDDFDLGFGDALDDDLGF